MLWHVQNGKRIGLHLCLAPESKMLVVDAVVGSLVDLREPRNLSSDEVEDGELALANLAVDHSRAEDERGEPEGGAERDEGNDEGLRQLDRVHG